MTTRERMDYDILIIGAGPAGLSAALRLAQLSKEHQIPLKIAVLEKGSEVGAHILSGAVLEPRALNELIPKWQTLNAPINTNVTEDEFLLLTQQGKIKLPTPLQMHNRGNYIISLENFCQWLSKQAESLGIEIFSGFAAVDVTLDNQGNVTGVVTNDVGVNKQGKPKPNFQEGMILTAKYTLVAEGCRGSLTKMLMDRFKLRSESCPQTYAIGLKEIWEISPSKHKKGKVTHTIGWPLDAKTYGGSFIYHMENNLISIGYVVGLDYENPYLDPYNEFQRFKQHPAVKPLLEDGKCIAYGARALNEGGLQAIPKLTFPGGLLIGCAAGFLNVPKIKGTHTAMKSGMLAAECVFEALKDLKKVNNLENITYELKQYEKMIRQSWIWEELYLARNIRPAFRWGLWAGLTYAALDTYIFRGKAPWTFRYKKPDYLFLKKTSQCKPIQYPKPDNKISFDKLTSLQLSNVSHEEDQPCHLKLKDLQTPISINLALYDAPEQRYCPAAVYRIVYDNNNVNDNSTDNNDKKPHLEINASNCIHCKTCDIKDPTQNITWVPPEGGGGPNYSNM